MDVRTCLLYGAALRARRRSGGLPSARWAPSCSAFPTSAAIGSWRRGVRTRSLTTSGTLDGSWLGLCESLESPVAAAVGARVGLREERHWVLIAQDVDRADVEPRHRRDATSPVPAHATLAAGCSAAAVLPALQTNRGLLSACRGTEVRLQAWDAVPPQPVCSWPQPERADCSHSKLGAKKGACASVTTALSGRTPSAVTPISHPPRPEAHGQSHGGCEASQEKQAHRYRTSWNSSGVVRLSSRATALLTLEEGS